ncbi:hypothetical protein CYY_009569 [Polysphondylium violaceum]|uniref:IPT/TIG domain-containing protein n=1 Tax=Polysphondylium violaceum TaxID=133409 RepID=A0A8J4PMM2_9MYCE|nr:hypothetical protein CYY_009569 [Polysphondylium violaceum]
MNNKIYIFVFLFFTCLIDPLLAQTPKLDKISPSFGGTVLRFYPITVSNLGAGATCYVQGLTTVSIAPTIMSSTQIILDVQGPATTSSKQYSIYCKNAGGVATNTLTFGVVNFVDNIQQNDDMYLLNDWYGLPNKDQVSIGNYPNAAYLTKVDYVNATHIKYKVSREMLAGQTPSLYDVTTSAFWSIMNLGYGPVIQSANFLALNSFNILGYTFPGLSQVSFLLDGTTIISPSISVSPESLDCRTDGLLFLQPRFMYTVKIYNSFQDRIFSTDMIFQFNYNLNGYTNSADEGTCTLISFGLALNPIAWGISPTGIPVAQDNTFKYPLDAKCGYLFTTSNSIRASNHLLVCPTPNITSIVTKPDGSNKLLVFKGNFLAQQSFDSDIPTPLTYSITYGDGTTATCSNLNTLWITEDSSYTVSCNIPQVYTFRLEAKTITNDYHSVLVGYTPTITSCSSLDYLVPGKVSIKGTQFASFNLLVQIGGKTCTNPTVNTGGTQIICDFTADIADPDNFYKALSVTVSVGSLYNTSSDLFYYNKRNPTVNSATPTTYDTAGVVTISGYAFLQNDVVVTIGGLACTNIVVNAHGNQITSSFASTVPPGDYKTPLDVYVGFESKYSDNKPVFYYNRPSPVLLSSSSTTYDTPGQVTILGKYFSPSSTIDITIGGAPCTGAIRTGDTKIVCDFDSRVSVINYSDLLDVNVTIDSVYTSKPLFKYIRPNPFISSSSSLSYNSAGIVSIIGKYYTPATDLVVTIGGKTCTSPSATESKITCLFSADVPVADFNDPLTISVSIDSQFTSSKDVFYYNRPTPTITSVSTLVYNQAGIVTIKGTYFAIDDLIVTIGDGECALPNVVSTSEITCTFQADIPTNDYFIDPLLVVVSVNSTSGSNSVFYYTRPDPVITSSSSLFFNQAGSITIKGSYLAYKGNDYIVQVGGSACILPNPNHQPTKDQIVCNYKSNVQISDYSTPLEVSVSIDSKHIVKSHVFYYIKPNPSISSASSTVYNISSNVTITGTQFVHDDLVVTIGQVECTSPSVSQDGNTIVCYFSSNATLVTSGDYQTPLEVFVSIKSTYTAKNSVFYYTIPSIPQPEPNNNNEPVSTQPTKSLSSGKIAAIIVCLVVGVGAATTAAVILIQKKRNRVDLMLSMKKY